MKTSLERVSCARIPAGSLIALARLRGIEDVSVIPEDDRVWVLWKMGDDRVLRAILPIPEIELFEKREGEWHRLGHRLPSFEGPPAVEPIALARAVTPEPFTAEMVQGVDPRPVRLRLARDSRPRSTSAMICPLSELARWAESATSADLEGIRGAISGDSALLLGRSLPPCSGLDRYWGRLLLVPIGFEPRPALAEPALLEALGASNRELLRLVPRPSGLVVEAIPLDVFRPLTRAGIRLASIGARAS